jgi:GNAT superfamily N-acetyltransferase
MDSGIRPAEKQDIPALCEIWEQCFDDSREYIELFYQSNFDRVKTLVYCRDGRPVSMMHLIDAVFRDGEKCQPARFVYATGTLKEYRNKGSMSALIKHITEAADKDGYALFLKPSSPSTEEFYKSFGFKPETALNTVNITPAENSPLTVWDISYSDYNRMREAAFDGALHVQWDDAHISWCIDENEYFSGKTLGIKYENKDSFLMGYPENGTLVINETDLSVKELSKISGALCGIFGTKRIKAYIPSAPGAEGEKAVTALLYNSRTDNTYINMIMI